MLLWRISDFASLGGIGGTLAAGRWNSKGQPIVYAAESSALAILEVLVRLETEIPPADYQLLRIECANELPTLEFPETYPPELARSRQWGDAWIAEGKQPLARVPSAIAPYCSNFLINPAHADAERLVVAAAGRYPWDARLFR